MRVARRPTTDGVTVETTDKADRRSSVVGRPSSVVSTVTPSVVLLVLSLAALVFGVASTALASRPAPETGGLGVATGGILTTYFLEPINYEDSGDYYDQSNLLQYTNYTFHHGVDISGGCVAGVNPVYAAADGTVALAQYINDGYGSQVALDHGYNVGGNSHYTYTFYSHMGNRNSGQSYIMVTPGQYVFAGQLIGYQGNDGSVYGTCGPDPGTHLDWEIRVSDTALSYNIYMRYGATAASHDFYTGHQLTYGDPYPDASVEPGPFSGGGNPTDTPVPTNTSVPEPTWTPGPCGMLFTDLPDTHWAYSYISYLFCHNVVSGYADGTFRPGETSTRGQFTKMIVLGYNWTLYNPVYPSFTDVPFDSAFYQYIETAHLRGIINGYADGTFQPGNAVTRAQAAKMLVLSHGWSPFDPGYPTFWDVPPDNWAYSWVESAYSHSIISGYADGAFHPEYSITRAQLSKMLVLTLQQTR